MATTLTDILTGVANYFEKTLADLTVNGQNLGLFAVNQVRRQAELNHDFEFQRKLVMVSVNGVTGGSLGDAVLYSDGVTAVDVKSVIEVGIFDSKGNLRPVEWTTVAESLERQRKEERFGSLPDLTLGENLPTLNCSKRFVLTGSQIFSFPKNTTASPVTLGLEVYGFSPDWTTPAGVTASGITGALATAGANGVYVLVGLFNGKPFYINTTGGGSVDFVLWWDSSATAWILCAGNVLSGYTSFSYFKVASSADTPPFSGWTAFGSGAGTLALVLTSVGSIGVDTWTTYAAQYLMWGTIVQLNHLFKHFVFRQEGNLPPPEKLRDDGLAAFIAWDSSRFEENRRHDR